MARLVRECEYPERYEMMTRETEFELAERSRLRRVDKFAVAAGVSFGVIVVGAIFTVIAAFVS